MRENQQDMANLLNEMYGGEYYFGQSLDYFSRFIYNLKKYDLAEILAYQSKFDFQYVLSFLLATPLLWINLSIKDWVRIMSLLNPRPKPFTKEIYIAGYVDIHFLCKYIKVNAIELFLQQDQFSNIDKKKLLQYSCKIADSLILDELDIEFLDGKNFVHHNEIEKVKLSLVSTGAIKPFNYTEDALRAYIEEKLTIFSDFDE
jgi:hypothetical protein